MFALRATVLRIGHGSFDVSIIASCCLLAQSFHAVSVPLSRKSNFNVEHFDAFCFCRLSPAPVMQSLSFHLCTSYSLVLRHAVTLYASLAMRQ